MWTWDKTANRYRDSDTGRFLSRSSVLGFVDQSISASYNITDALAGYVANGQLTALDWAGVFKTEIKGEYIRQYLLGIGGRNMMTAADWGSIGGMLKEQFGFLDNFIAEIAAGKVTEGQIRVRMQMYINSAREAHERAHAKTAVKWDADEVGWNLLPSAAHCDDCLANSNRGFQPIGPKGGFPGINGEEFPGDGNTQCLTACKCSLSYRNSVTGEEFMG